MRLPKLGRMYEFTLFGKEGSFYSSSFKGDRGYEKGLHGRGSLSFNGSRANLEWHFPSTRLSVSFQVEDDGGDVALHGSLCLPPVALYWEINSALARRISGRVMSLFPSDMGFTWSGRRFDLSVHDTAIWWKLGADDMGWTSSRPKWKDGSWHPLGHHMVQGEFETLEEREIVVSMPERDYRGKACLQRYRMGYTKLPRLFDKIAYSVKIDMHEGEQIPTPGKGENSWDCGDDATFGISCPARTIEEGVGYLVGSVLRDRRRHGGKNWQPDPKETQVAS